MSDDINTGTPNESKTYTEEEVQELLKGARQEGETKAYRHWQSVADKLVAAERANNQKLAEELQQLKNRMFEGLSPEDKVKAVWEEINRGSVANEPSNDEEPPQDVGDLRESINNTLKELGIDPSKVDWADDADGPTAMKRFIGSIIKQLQPVASQKHEGSRVDTSRSVGGNIVDLKTFDSMAAIRRGLMKGPR